MDAFGVEIGDYLLVTWSSPTIQQELLLVGDIIRKEERETVVKVSCKHKYMSGWFYLDSLLVFAKKINREEAMEWILRD